MMIAIMALAAFQLPADFSYQETTKITGGAIASMMKVAAVFSKQAREPIQTTVAIKGDKMVHRSQEHATVIDLGAETITTVDMQKKTYTVMTFQEFKQMMDQMAQKMNEPNNQGKVDFKVSAKDTGNSKEIAGYNAKELVLRMEMQFTDQKTGQQGSLVTTSDMWLAPAITGYSEVREFQRRMAEKLSFNPGGGLFMSSPEASKNMSELSKEMSKLDGMPVLQTIVMGGAGDPGQTTAGQQGQQPPAQQQADRPSLGGALGGALGGKFGLGRKRKQDDQSQQQSSGQQGSGQPGSLMEATTEMNSFSSAPVDPSLFDVPAGFKKVEAKNRPM